MRNTDATNMKMLGALEEFETSLLGAPTDCPYGEVERGFAQYDGFHEFAGVKYQLWIDVDERTQCITISIDGCWEVPSAGIYSLCSAINLFNMRLPFHALNYVIHDDISDDGCRVMYQLAIKVDVDTFCSNNIADMVMAGWVTLHYFDEVLSAWDLHGISMIDACSKIFDGVENGEEAAHGSQRQLDVDNLRRLNSFGEIVPYKGIQWYLVP